MSRLGARLGVLTSHDAVVEPASTGLREPRTGGTVGADWTDGRSRDWRDPRSRRSGLTGPRQVFEHGIQETVVNVSLPFITVITKVFIVTTSATVGIIVLNITLTIQFIIGFELVIAKVVFGDLIWISKPRMRDKSSSEDIPRPCL